MTRERQPNVNCSFCWVVSATCLGLENLFWCLVTCHYTCDGIKTRQKKTINFRLTFAAHRRLCLSSLMWVFFTDLHKHASIRADVCVTMASYISIESLLNIESDLIIIFSCKNCQNILRRKTRDLFKRELPLFKSITVCNRICKFVGFW